MSKIIKRNWLFFVWLTLYFGFISWRLINHPTPFFDWDEAIYMQSGKEMWEQKSYFIPLWQGQIWLDKPPLIPLIYALVANSFAVIAPPEISTRLFTLIIALLTLTLIYFFYLKIIKDCLAAFLVVLISSSTPIFFQRSQVVNLDVFLLLGWSGYLLFFEKFWLSFFFLFLAVFSKSLLGFYPPLIMTFYYLYLFFKKKVRGPKLISLLKKISFQIAMLLSWYLIMGLIFGQDFINQHLIESHWRRVASSIEFHFGERIFYLTLAYQQMHLFALLALVGLMIATYELFLKNKINLLPYLLIVPWYLFLNLTKTKIFWYFFSSIPQLAALSIYPLIKLKKKPVLYYGLFFFLLGYLIFTIKTSGILTTNFSQKEDYYYLSLYAKSHCRQLTILLNPATRHSFAALDNMGLTITTTKWWGAHPSIIYYFGKKVNLFYDDTSFIQQLKQNSTDCFVVEKDDYQLINLQLEKKYLLKQFNNYYLYRYRL
jgi:4-amino-4-deoxy-L-arabinose transferase-like glycosyltransferase